MKLGQALLNVPATLENPPAEQIQCEAMCKPSRWDKANQLSLQCSFRAIDKVDGKHLCGTHARLAARTSPVWVDVQAFIVSERDRNSPLWKSIVAAYEARKK